MELKLPDHLAPFLAYLRAFKKVRDASFGSYPRQYDRNCPAYIQEVLKTSEALEQFGLNFIPKLHMLLHVPEFCESVNAPLGDFGDQGVEPVIINTTVSFLQFKRRAELIRNQFSFPCKNISQHVLDCR